MDKKSKLLIEMFFYIMILAIGIFIIVTGKGIPKNKPIPVHTTTPYTTNSVIPEGEE